MSVEKIPAIKEKTGLRCETKRVGMIFTQTCIFYLIRTSSTPVHSEIFWNIDTNRLTAQM